MLKKSYKYLVLCEGKYKTGVDKISSGIVFALPLKMFYVSEHK
jgi:hypothetical protein